ncbi:MAG TPA: type II secretion system F family protein [Bryobacteraceae bacterium]|nr:type II secretion system F family protein [Bryobacteraceae bacterium]
MLALSSILVFLTTFLAAGLAVLIAWFALQRMNAQALAEDVSEHLLDDTPRLLKNDALSTISPWAKLLERSDFVKIMHRHLIQADLRWSVGRITLLMLLTASVTLAIAMRYDLIPGWAALLIAAAVGSLPYLYILRRRAKRFRQFEENFPDALDSLSRSLRAGHPFAASMEIVAEECEQPVAAEMRQTAIEGNLGTSWAQALANLAERLPLLEVNMFVSAAQLQSRTGGKLNEVLASLAENMRESSALKGEVRALAAHGKLTGMVLTILPIVIAFVMMMVNPSYLVILIYHPYGKYLITAAVVCLLLAHLVIRKIVDIRV